MRIGFVGLGPMGQAMAGRLLNAGHSLTVYNRTAARADPLVAAGACLAASPAAAARDADLVFSMLADDAAAEALALGPDGIAAGLPPGAIHLSSSTISVALSQRLAAAHGERNQHYLAAPVLGRPPAAAEGQLFVVLAGDPAAAERARPALDAFARRVFTVGAEPSRANLVKLSLNFMIFSTIEQMAEMFALNEKGGVPAATLFTILTDSFFGAPVHRNYGQLVVEQRFDPPGATMTLAAKDTALLLEAADALSVPLPMGSLLRDRLLASIARGEAGLDFAALSNRARDDAGLP